MKGLTQNPLAAGGLYTNPADLFNGILRDFANAISPRKSQRGNCDICDQRPSTHRHDMYGIETWICDECAIKP